MTTFTDARRDPRAASASRAGTFILAIDHRTETVAVSHNLLLLAVPIRDRLRTFDDLFATATADGVEAALTADFHSTFRAKAERKADADLAAAFRDGYQVRVVRVWHEPVTPTADVAGDGLRRLLATAPAVPADSGTARFLATLTTEGTDTAEASR